MIDFRLKRACKNKTRRWPYRVTACIRIVSKPRDVYHAVLFVKWTRL